MSVLGFGSFVLSVWYAPLFSSFNSFGYSSWTCKSLCESYTSSFSGTCFSSDKKDQIREEIFGEKEHLPSKNESERSKIGARGRV